MGHRQTAVTKVNAKIRMEGAKVGIKALGEGAGVNDCMAYNPYTFKEVGYYPWLFGWQWAFGDDLDQELT